MSSGAPGYRRRLASSHRSRSASPAAAQLITAAAVGPRSVGPRSVGLRSVGLRSVGPRSVGLRSVGLRAAWLAMLLALCLPATAAAPAGPTRNLILVTIDGLRWQEVFTGADPQLLGDPAQGAAAADADARFRAADADDRRRRLLPFLWTVVARHGQLHGNAAAGNRIKARNAYGVSYPGYNEILTGRADDARITSNAPIANPNRSFLADLNRLPGFQGAVAAFASWERFTWILDEQHSGLPINAGLREARGASLSWRERRLNQLTRSLPHPWAPSRQDALTHGYAMAYLQRKQPRVLYVAYGDADEHAHQGQYHEYLAAARRADDFLRELWQWTQSRAGYRGNTALMVATDHGRGSGSAWRDHGRTIAGSHDAWLAIMGPDTPALGEQLTPATHYLEQIASTAMALLGFDSWRDAASWQPIDSALARNTPP